MTTWRTLVLVLVGVGGASIAVRQFEHREASRTSRLHSCARHMAGLGVAPPVSEPPATVSIGRRLFDDPMFSSDGRVSCESCHRAGHAFGDPRRVSVGVRGATGTRNAPTLQNLAYADRFFWDGRVPTLAAAARQALRNPTEMNSTNLRVRRAVRRLDARSRHALGDKPTLATVANFVASYVSAIRVGDSRVDRFLYCGDRYALTAAERRGLALFRGRANCQTCHTINHISVSPLGGTLALFTDDRFHVTGVGSSHDPGRGAMTHRPADSGAFKTPTLRNVALSAPYMHDGSIRTLRSVIEFYNRGGNPRPNLDPSMRPLGLSHRNVDDLVAFLRALTSAPRLVSRGSSQNSS